jgi:hypothetical protein
MKKLYGEQIRKESGLVKTVKNTTKPLLENSIVERVEKRVSEELDRLKEKLAGVLKHGGDWEQLVDKSMLAVL